MQLTKLFELPQNAKYAILLLWDALGVIGALMLAYFIRVGIESASIEQQELMLSLANAVVTLVILTLLGHYRQIIRYIGVNAGVIILIGITCSAIFLYLVKDVFGVFLPQSVPIMYWMFAVILIGGPRVLINISAQSQGYKMREKCLIFGADQAGRSLAATLKQGKEMQAVAFVDDKSVYHGKEILGIPVVPRNQIPILIEKYDINRMLLAVHNTSPTRRQELIRELEPYSLELLSIPDMAEIASGKRKIDELREVSIEELLGREPVPPIKELLNVDIFGKHVMVTGAGGSIGSELCRQIVKSQPASLVLFELSEFNLYQIEIELRTKYPDTKFIPVLASVQDSDMLRDAIKRHSIQTIYHAAAYKHVPMVEANPVAGLRNNVFGTANTCLIAAEFDVEKFVLVSTDKAVRPTNIMGASKRFAELIVQGLAELHSNTKFAIVRFGNVLGSSGSVVPLFTRQIRAGGPITVTHPDIIRYFMTIPEAAQLVIQAGAMGERGEVFVLDMGEPVKIVDLATKMASLMGHRLSEKETDKNSLHLKFTGLRPGEKLYEELLIEDSDTETQHPRIMGANEQKLPFEDVVMSLDQLNYALVTANAEEARRILLDEVPLGYHPMGG